MSRKLKQMYPTIVALALAVALLYDAALFIMVMAAAIAAMPLAYGDEVDEIARAARARSAASRGRPEP